MIQSSGMTRFACPNRKSEIKGRWRWVVIEKSRIGPCLSLPPFRCVSEVTSEDAHKREERIGHAEHLKALCSIDVSEA
jgi:hypothetical protein